jgi:hypothetical protein
MSKNQSGTDQINHCQMPVLSILQNAPRRKGKFDFYEFPCIGLETLLEVTERQASFLINDSNGEKWLSPDFKGRVILDYPFKVIVALEIDRAESVGSLLWQIATAYQKIYKEEEESALGKPRKKGAYIYEAPGKFGIWGHHMDVLVAEQLEIYSDGTAFINLGS